MIRTTSKSHLGYYVEPNVDEKEWEKGREYTLWIQPDNAGDTVFVLVGPGVDLCTYSKWAVDEALAEAGVTCGVNIFDHLDSWEVNPLGVVSADFD